MVQIVSFNFVYYATFFDGKLATKLCLNRTKLAFPLYKWYCYNNIIILNWATVYSGSSGAKDKIETISVSFSFAFCSFHFFRGGGGVVDRGQLFQGILWWYIQHGTIVLVTCIAAHLLGLGGGGILGWAVQGFTNSKSLICGYSMPNKEWRGEALKADTGAYKLKPV